MFTTKEVEKKPNLSLSTVVFIIPDGNTWTFVYVEKDRRYVSVHVKLIGI